MSKNNNKNKQTHTHTHTHTHTYIYIYTYIYINTYISNPSNQQGYNVSKICLYDTMNNGQQRLPWED